MSKNSRRVDWLVDSSPIATKRVCKSTHRSTLIQSEDILWPDTDDESFFSNSKIDNLMTNFSQQQNSDGTVHSDGGNDSLFGELKLPEEEEGNNVTATPMKQVFPTDIEGNDTMFSEINLDDLTGDEKEDLFSNNSAAENCLQCTQKFLDDVAAMKLPEAACKEFDDSFFSKTLLEGLVQGTQYETKDDIQNRTANAIKSTILEGQCVKDAMHLNWETQAFTAVETPSDLIPSKGEFYGLPDKVKRLIFEHKGIESLYEWQDECLNLPAIHKRRNLIYALPTSGGKTLVAEILMLREILCREKNVIFILPYVSIVQEKVSAMSPFAIALNFIIEEYTAGKGKCPPVPRNKRRSIFIASIEKGAILFDSLIEAERANEIGLVVVDELHLIGEKGRGAALESFLTKVLFLNANIQIVGMSATIGNLTEISTFLNADVYTRGFRPVELKEYIKCGNDILEINTAGQTVEEVFVYKRTVNFKYTEAVRKSDPDHLAGLVSECAPENCCLVFCASRKNCENVAVLLSRILPKTKFLEYRKKEKTDLMDALDKICGILSPVLAKTIPYGIAYHHSGLTTDERKFIETAYRFGVLSVICCTSTLAAGVNLPAKRVIIRAPYVGNEFMTLCKYKQMVGRAGRAGLGEAGESYLISSSRDNVRVGEMLFSPMDKVVSSLVLQDGIGLQSLVLSSIGLGLTVCRNDLARLIDGTLLAAQSTQLGISTGDLTLNIVREMFKNRVLQTCANVRRDYSEILTTQDTKNITRNCMPERRIFISKSTRFELTPIGRAAFKAGIDYKRAYIMHNELKAGQSHMILTNYAHLLYLVICFNSSVNGDELFAADPAILFNLYSTLEEATLVLFKTLGFTESYAAKIAKTASIKGPMELKLNRLFKVLILTDVLQLVPLPNVASKYNVERGMLQNLISQSTAAASAIVRLCDQIDEFWCFKPLFEHICAKIDRCGTIELEALLELPTVKINRARQLYAAGFRTIEDIAQCRPMHLVKSVEHMPLRVAKEIISAAKIILMKKLDHLEEETEILKKCLNQDNSSQ